jgi:transcriptional regulator with XRE-family HTH domain
VKRKPTKPSLTRRKSYKDEAGIKRFGDRLREIRKSKNITQEQLQHLTGFDLRQLGRIERAEVSTNISHVFRIAECLGVAPHELFMFPPEKPSKKGK